MGLRLAKPTTWRTVPLFSCAISLVQLAISPFVTESPSWLRSKGGVEDVKRIEKRLWSTSEATFGPSAECKSIFSFLFTFIWINTLNEWITAPDADAEARDPLLEREVNDENESEADRRLRVAHKQAPAVSFLDLVKSSELRRPLAIVCFAMTSQQLSGKLRLCVAYSNFWLLTLCNDVELGHRYQCWCAIPFGHIVRIKILTSMHTVLYYSNDILSKALPDLGPFVSLGITIINAIMTFPPIFLIEVCRFTVRSVWSFDPD